MENDFLLISLSERWKIHIISSPALDFSAIKGRHLWKYLGNSVPLGDISSERDERSSRRLENSAVNQTLTESIVDGNVARNANLNKNKIVTLWFTHGRDHHEFLRTISRFRANLFLKRWYRRCLPDTWIASLKVRANLWRRIRLPVALRSPIAGNFACDVCHGLAPPLVMGTSKIKEEISYKKSSRETLSLSGDQVSTCYQSFTFEWLISYIFSRAIL